MGKRRVKFGFLFWVGFILLIALLGFINKDNIKSVLEQTNAKEFFKGKEAPEEKATPEIKIQEEIDRIFEEDNSTTGDGSASEPSKNEASDKNTKEKVETSSKTESAKKEQKSEKNANSKNQKKPKKSDDTKSAESAKKPKAVSVSVKLYFVKIDTDGNISRVVSKRSLPKSNSPMSDALKALFRGATEKEAGSGYKSLVPSGTKLLGAKVENGVAYINVSEAFEFNQYGIEGYLAQLSQVVYTATEYSTVKSVQFLIEGQKKEFLGAEGVWIGSPLSRSSF
ncbi:MAG: hypothetical protein CR988_01685 [Treponema sp.]|nr:MAG: hypothetical protein CR988_01685 [Treponema sp.]